MGYNLQTHGHTYLAVLKHTNEQPKPETNMKHSHYLKWQQAVGKFRCKLFDIIFTWFNVIYTSIFRKVHFCFVRTSSNDYCTFLLAMTLLPMNFIGEIY